MSGQDRQRQCSMSNSKIDAVRRDEYEQPQQVAGAMHKQQRQATGVSTGNKQQKANIGFSASEKTPRQQRRKQDNITTSNKEQTTKSATSSSSAKRMQEKRKLAINENKKTPCQRCQETSEVDKQPLKAASKMGSHTPTSGHKQNV